MILLVFIIIVVLVNLVALYFILNTLYRSNTLQTKQPKPSTFTEIRNDETENKTVSGQLLPCDNKDHDKVSCYNNVIQDNLTSNMIPWSSDIVQLRDRAVLDDPLYPPLNRQSMEPHDNYRFIGYLVNEEAKDDTWKLFARSKNRNQAQFYASLANNNIDKKIVITDDMTRKGNRLRDLYNLPESVVIDHPLFSSQSYTVVENPKTDFNSFYF